MSNLYAIAGTIERARLMLEAGVPYLQLRFKGRPLEEHREEVAHWPAAFPATRLIVNDDLDLAEAVRAWGVHLGQEDLQHYTRTRLVETPIQVGISTHSDEEIALAMEYAPTLLGFGPIFATTTKEMLHGPQGMERLREVVATAPVPIVAIGGIALSNIEEVARSGVALVAMIGQLEQMKSAAEVRALMSRLEP